MRTLLLIMIGFLCLTQAAFGQTRKGAKTVGFEGGIANVDGEASATGSAHSDENVLEVGCLGGAYFVVNENENGKRIRGSLMEILLGYFPTEKNRFDMRFAWGSWRWKTLTRFSMAYSLFPFGSNTGFKPYVGFGFGFQSAGVVLSSGIRSFLNSHFGLRQKIGGRGSVFFETKANWVFDRWGNGDQWFTTWLQISGGFSVSLPL